MGRDKLGLGLGGRSFLARALAALAPASPRLVVVAPGRADAARQAGAVPPAQVLENPDPSRGMLSSVAAGIEAAGEGWALVLPVDCPLVAPETTALLVAASRATPRTVAVVPEHAGRRGHPVLLGPDVGRAVRDAMTAGVDTHLEALLDRFSDRVVALPVDDPAVLDNVNTPGDVAVLRARWGAQT